MPDDRVLAYRAEPDGEFADRLERELLQRLTFDAAEIDGETTLPLPEFAIQDLTRSDRRPADTAPKPDRRTTPRRRLVLAGAAVIVLAAAVSAYRWSREEAADTVVAGDPAATTPDAYLAIADSFMDAWVTRDGRAVASKFRDPLTHEDSPYVALGSDVPQVGIGWVESPEGGMVPAITDVWALPALHDWFRATGWDFHRGPCRLVEPSMPEVKNAANAVCDYTYDNDLTRAVGHKTVRGQLALMMVGNDIATLGGGLFDADADVWLRFHDWVRREDSGAVRIMYVPTTPPRPHLVPGSIALWRRDVAEFAASPEAHATSSSVAPTPAQFGAQARVICASEASDFQAPWVWGGGLESMGPASEASLDKLRALPRPQEDTAKIDHLFSLLEQINSHIVADDWFHNPEFDRLVSEKNALGGRDFWGCPVGPLGG